MARISRPDRSPPEVGDQITELTFEYGNLVAATVQSQRELARRYFFGSGWALMREGLRRLLKGVSIET